MCTFFVLHKALWLTLNRYSTRHGSLVTGSLMDPGRGSQDLRMTLGRLTRNGSITSTLTMQPAAGRGGEHPHSNMDTLVESPAGRSVAVRYTSFGVLAHSRQMSRSLRSHVGVMNVTSSFYKTNVKLELTLVKCQGYSGVMMGTLQTPRV